MDESEHGRIRNLLEGPCEGATIEDGLPVRPPPPVTTTTSSTPTTVISGTSDVLIANIVYDASGNDVVYNDSEYVVLRIREMGRRVLGAGGWLTLRTIGSSFHPGIRYHLEEHSGSTRDPATRRPPGTSTGEARPSGTTQEETRPRCSTNPTRRSTRIPTRPELPRIRRGPAGHIQGHNVCIRRVAVGDGDAGLTASGTLSAASNHVRPLIPLC